MIKISDYISYLPATKDPLSADVFLIDVDNKQFFFDVGSNDEAFSLVNNTKNDGVIISHFHQDHAANLKRLDLDKLFLSKESYKHYLKGQVINNYLALGKLEIIECPSSHSKGSLLLNINNEYCLVGDSLYGKMINGKLTYNQALLSQQINTINSINTKYFVSSHTIKISTKEEVLIELNKIFASREKDNPLIIVD